MTFKVIQGQGQGEEMTSVPYRDYFYRVMHYSAKRGLTIARRLSGCLSVCLRRWWIRPLRLKILEINCANN